jgi:hypothetical protein
MPFMNPKKPCFRSGFRDGTSQNEMYLGAGKLHLVAMPPQRLEPSLPVIRLSEARGGAQAAAQSPEKL